MSLRSQTTLIELTAFEAVYLKTKGAKYAANLTITFNNGQETCKSDRRKIKSRSEPLGRLIEPKTKSKQYQLDLSHIPPTIVKRVMCFLHTGDYKQAAAKSAISDHLEMIRFGEQYQVLSLPDLARRQLLASWWEWWEHDRQIIDFGVCIGSIPAIYNDIPADYHEGIRRVRKQLSRALDFPLLSVQLTELQRYGQIYPLFKQDMLTELEIDLSRVFMRQHRRD